MGDLVEAKPRAPAAAKSKRSRRTAPRKDTAAQRGPAGRGAAAAEPPAGKAIVLFSDGTGNSSAQLFKTNVWRMYEATDLGPPAEGKRHQISYYDDGVGTSSFKPLAMLGGAFGYGLKRNVLDLYRYACRNYRDGDEIFGFGFSRGAFTMRLVIALIASEGLVKSDSEAELERKSRCAYRSFRRHFLPRKLEWPTRLFRGIRDGIGGWRARRRGEQPYSSESNRRPTIRFVGVWDTVAAYGGPVAEITRAIDNWIYPLSMPSYDLSERVETARHALALDDERDAFHPLLWDEVHEQELIEDGKVKPGRLEQVWFTGMHADVGGGYPDESLSYVSLLWMMEEAEKAGLRTLRVVKDRIVALASSYGPLHDSRAGLGSYYRYQPRKLSAWTDPVDPSTLSLRDPEIVDGEGRQKGLLCSVKIHESVINRIAHGTDRYAPINLPPSFSVVPPQREGENVPQADSEDPAPVELGDERKPLVDRAVLQRLADPDIAGARAAAIERLWNRVWWRRLIYFATLAATLLLALTPFWIEVAPAAPILDDGRTWIGGIIRMLTLAVPAFADDWVQIYADNPFYFLLLVGVIVLLLGAGARTERAMRDRARLIWRAATCPGPPPQAPPRRSAIERMRNGRVYQSTVQKLKWWVLPDWVFAPVMIAFLAWLGLAAYTQVRLPFLEPGLCRHDPNARPIENESRNFRTSAICGDSYGTVREGERYVVRFDVLDEWKDSSFDATPEGLAARDLSWGLGYLAGPFRRVIDAGFLQPVAEVRPHRRTNNPFGNLQIYPLEVRRVGDSPTQYEAEFMAPRSGELFLFANDAMIPLTSSIWGRFDYRHFYEASGFGTERGNRGTACVNVVHSDAVPAAARARAAPPPDSVCGRVATRNARAQAAEEKRAAVAASAAAARAAAAAATPGGGR